MIAKSSAKPEAERISARLQNVETKKGQQPRSFIPAKVTRVAAVVGNPPFRGFKAEQFSETGTFSSLSEAVRALHNSHLVLQVRRESDKDACFLLVIARDLEIMFDQGVDETVASQQELFDSKAIDGRFPTSLIFAACSRDLHDLVGIEAISFVRAGESLPIRELLNSEMPDETGSQLLFRRMMLRDRAAVEVSRFVISALGQRRNRSLSREIVQAKKDFGADDGGADLLHSLENCLQWRRFMMIQVKGGISGNPFRRFEMDAELKKHYLTSGEKPATKARNRRLHIYPELQGPVSDPFIFDDLAERLGFVFSRSVQPGLGKPFWAQGQRRRGQLKQLATAYMPWLPFEFALLHTEW